MSASEIREHAARSLIARLSDCLAFTPQDWARFINDWAHYQGWNEPNRSESEWAALAHTEISEAFEEYRNHKPMIYTGENDKPEGMAIEYADLLIRVLHWFAAHHIDPVEALAIKMDYNISRPFRHGGLRA